MTEVSQLQAIYSLHMNVQRVYSYMTKFITFKNSYAATQSHQLLLDVYS